MTTCQISKAGTPLLTQLTVDHENDNADKIFIGSDHTKTMMPIPNEYGMVHSTLGIRTNILIAFPRNIIGSTTHIKNRVQN